MTTPNINELTIESVSMPEGFCIIRLNGWVTAINSPQFQEAVDKTRGTSTIVDLTSVPYMDSSGLGVLLRGYVGCQKNGGQFMQAGMVPRVHELLQLTKVATLFPTYPNTADAAAALKKAAGK